MESQKVRILLVEDDPDDVWVMRSLLGDRWDGPFELVHVEMLSFALRRCNEELFDVILLDLALPDSQGLGTFITMHAHAGGIPIVVLSGYDDEMTAMKAVQAGAEDYLVKGQVDDNLLVRSIRYAIERGRRHYAEEALRNTSEEFRAAQEIQQRLFPAGSPSVNGFDIAGALYPAKATAGDYFDYIPMNDGCIGIVVGDVSGHGVGPAILMSETRACLRTLAQSFSDVGDILTRANRVLAADMGDFHFITLAMARLDPGTRMLVYASCGQRGYLLDSDHGVKTLDSTSLPLGVERDSVVPASPPLTLQSGQLVTFFTDGVFEAESPGKVRFGAERALQVIDSERDKPARAIIDALYQEISGFSRHLPQRDDITMVVVKVE
ncbi:MAG: SpoIIE family protein phosphatase [Pirellulales bacterium]|nr:SpoIIE family protein phosphatase [Pirellulales bacterium]